MKNEIFVHTDKGAYIGGETIYGTVYLCIVHPIGAKSVYLEVKGHEKTDWEDKKTEWYDDVDGTRKTREVIVRRTGCREFFCNRVPLIAYPGGFPLGHSASPFRYRLPAELPGIFREEGAQFGCKWKGKIEYKVKAVVDLPGTKHDLMCKQHLYVYERLDTAIQPKHHQKTQEVRMCCCIAKGPVHVEAWMDKNAYMAGETAQIHVKVKNDSSVRVNHFNTHLIREVILRDDSNYTHQIRDTVATMKYDGCDPFSSKESAVPLPLVSMGKNIPPSTRSKMVSCEYKVLIEMDIPWCPDVEIYSPVKIYAVQNPMWAAWQPPTWISTAQVQSVCAEFAVPTAVLQQRFQGGGFTVSASAPPINIPAAQVSFNMGGPTGQANVGVPQVNMTVGVPQGQVNYGAPQAQVTMNAPGAQVNYGAPQVTVDLGGFTSQSGPSAFSAGGMKGEVEWNVTGATTTYSTENRGLLQP